MPQDIETAYLAGIIDGEGCVMIYPSRGCFIVRLDIAQKNYNHLKLIQDIWGGRMQKGIKGSYHLIWQGKKALPILQKCLFYSKFKTQQIGLALLYLTDISKGRGYKVDVDSATNVYKQLKELKIMTYANSI